MDHFFFFSFFTFIYLEASLFTLVTKLPYYPPAHLFFFHSYFLLIWFPISHYIELHSINLSQFFTMCFARSSWKFSYENISARVFNKRYYPSSPVAELFEADESYNSSQLPKASPLWKTTSVLSFSLWNMKCCHVVSCQNTWEENTDASCSLDRDLKRMNLHCSC